MLKNLKLNINKYLINSSETFAKLYFFGRRKRLGARLMDTKAQAIGHFIQKTARNAPAPSVKQSRLNMLAGTALFDEACPALLRKENIVIMGAEGKLNARLYSDTAQKSKNIPILLYFHGGGFMQGDLETHDGICGKLAKWGNCIVIAVDYRRAPESKFPAGIDDAIAAFKWVKENVEKWDGDASRIGVCGDSAGGNLAAVICQQQALSGNDIPFLQVLIYPGLDSTLSTNSAAELPAAYILPKARLSFFIDNYTSETADLSDIRISPLNNKELAAQPKAYIVSAGFDPLRDEASQYAEQLNQCGVDVQYKEYSGQIHAFINFCKVVPQANVCIREIADWLKINWEIGKK
ncbi:MAG: alpha/beta hydrolase [Hyphomicrobiales bacterium]